jgi:hypothetical protein
MSSIDTVKMTVRVSLLRRNAACVQAEFGIGEGVAGLSIGLDPDNMFAFSLAVLSAPDGTLRYNKWLRSGERLTLGHDPAHTGLGGVPGPIEPGRWSLRLFTPESALKTFAPEEQMSIVVRLGETTPNDPLPDGAVILQNGAESVEPRAGFSDIASERPDWYKGDFHAHTCLSDGKESVESVIEKAKRMNLDFYTATDHNTVHTAWPCAPPLLLPGIEITSKRGHFNIIGLRELPVDFFEPENMDEGFVKPERIEAILAESKRNGAVNSLNHPFLCEWKWDMPDISPTLFHAMEIICDPTYPFSREANERALELWTRLWNRGNRIYGLGGSDSHNLENERYEGASEPSIPGDPASWVHCGSLTRENLIFGVKAGHVWVCCGNVKLYPKFSAGGSSLLPGDRIWSENGVVALTCSLRADHAPEGTRAQWIVNGKICGEAPLGETEEIFQIGIDASRYSWARIDIRDADGALYGFVNPVWWGKRPNEFQTFGQAAKGLNAVEER